MKPHKWAKEIKAWADGAEIEVKDIRSDWWTIQNPQWLESGDVEYRIKPQPKESQYLYVFIENIPKRKTTFIYDMALAKPDWNYVGKIKLETDDE